MREPGSSTRSASGSESHGCTRSTGWWCSPTRMEAGHRSRRTTRGQRSSSTGTRCRCAMSAISESPSLHDPRRTEWSREVHYLHTLDGVGIPLRGVSEPGRDCEGAGRSGTGASDGGRTRDVAAFAGMDGEPEVLRSRVHLVEPRDRSQRGGSERRRLPGDLDLRRPEQVVRDEKPGAGPEPLRRPRHSGARLRSAASFARSTTRRGSLPSRTKRISWTTSQSSPETVAVVHRGIMLFRDTARAAWVERATAGLAPARPMWGREAVLEWVRRAEHMSDELREELGSYRAEIVTSGEAGVRPAAGDVTVSIRQRSAQVRPLVRAP